MAELFGKRLLRYNQRIKDAQDARKEAELKEFLLRNGVRVDLPPDPNAKPVIRVKVVHNIFDDMRRNPFGIYTKYQAIAQREETMKETKGGPVPLKQARTVITLARKPKGKYNGRTADVIIVDDIQPNA